MLGHGGVGLGHGDALGFAQAVEDLHGLVDLALVAQLRRLVNLLVHFLDVVVDENRKHALSLHRVALSVVLSAIDADHFHGRVAGRLAGLHGLGHVELLGHLEALGHGDLSHHLLLRGVVVLAILGELVRDARLLLVEELRVNHHGLHAKHLHVLSIGLLVLTLIKSVSALVQHAPHRVLVGVHGHGHR